LKNFNRFGAIFSMVQTSHP